MQPPTQPYSEFYLSGQRRSAFQKCLKLERILFKKFPFYTAAANHFLKAAMGKDPRLLQCEEVDAILNAVYCDKNLEDWQYVQLIDAVRILLTKYFDSTQAGSYNWSYFKDSIRTVSGDHATTAREHTPDELIHLKVKRGNGQNAETRRVHRDLIIRFVTEIRSRGYSYRTEEAYEQWVVRYIAFCKGKPPVEVGPNHVTKYLHDLVINGNVSASTQNQALNALIFLYKQVLRVPVGQLDDFTRSKRKVTLPVVMFRNEVKAHPLT